MREPEKYDPSKPPPSSQEWIRHAIMRDVCELSPANPEDDETICVTYEQLNHILADHLEGTALCSGESGKQEMQPSVVRYVVLYLVWAMAVIGLTLAVIGYVACRE